MESNTTHIVVDMLYDFINGSLACKNTEKAIDETIKYINKNPKEKVLYVCDHHPIDHCSFTENGGVWPTHCVEGTLGGQIHEDFYKKIENTSNRPSSNNIFLRSE